MPRIFGPEGGSRSKAAHSPPLDQAPPSLAVRQQPLILKSMWSTTPPVRPCVLPRAVICCVYEIRTARN